MKLLLHTCCAPCLIYPLEKLSEKGFGVTGFFYNPNIHPFFEYQNRKNAVEDLSKTVNIEVICPEYAPQEFFQAVNPAPRAKTRGIGGKYTNTALHSRSKEWGFTGGGVNLKEDKPKRCFLCWLLRLKRTAREAKEKGFEYFSTTLLVSPYQDQELLKKIGNTISRREGVNFHYEDFRPGFKDAHNKAKSQGIYCQKYCGCIYSMKPRLTERSERKSAG